LLSRLHEGAEIDVAARDPAILRRAEVGVGQVDLGGREVCLGLLDLSRRWVTVSSAA
jgi:hypothetical protein